MNPSANPIRIVAVSTIILFPVLFVLMRERALRRGTLNVDRLQTDDDSQIEKGACMKTNLMMAMIVFSAAGGVAAQGGTHSFTGVVSDNMCGKQHMAKNKSAAQCTRECVKAGQDYALVVGDKVYTLNGDKSAIDKYAGEKATVIGTAKDDSITVSSISGPKK